MYPATTKVDYRPALKRLTKWLKGQDLHLINSKEWAHWDFNNRPFWSAWVLVASPSISGPTWGIQIYKDGEILMVLTLEQATPRKEIINEQNIQRANEQINF